MNRVPKSFLEFDDAGASDNELAKGVMVGDIRAWHDQYDRMLTTWAECRSLLSGERRRNDELVRVLMKIKGYNVDTAAGHMNYRPHDHIQVIDDVLNPIHPIPLREIPDTENYSATRLVDHDGSTLKLPLVPACASCKKQPTPDCDNPACAFRTMFDRKCNHWPGQKRCGVCGMGASAQALDHLCNALYFVADIHPDDRNEAIDKALAFYNEQRPNLQVQPSEFGYRRVLRVDSEEGNVS